MPYSSVSSTCVFYTDNDSDSLADALKAAGVAQALRAWLYRLDLPSTPITIVDKGGYHEIRLPIALDRSAVEGIVSAFAAGKPELLVSASQAKKAEEGGRRLQGFDYEAHKANRDTYFKQYLSRPQAERARIAASPDFEAIQRLAPPADYSLYAYINQFKIAAGYNALVEQWQAASPSTAQANLRFLLRAFSVTPNPMDEAVEEWQTQVTKAEREASFVTRLQIINPTAGKGANAPKASTLRIGGLDGFWLVEYLKFVGLFTLGVPLVVKGAKDRKTYVLRPVHAELSAIDSVMTEFRKHVSGNTAVKVDIVTTMRFTEALVTYLRDAMLSGRHDPLLAMFGQAPRLTDIARGFDVAFYKDMGSAYATMNLATVNLPDWLDRDESLATPERADMALALLGEHLRVISGIRTTKGDEGSDEYELLRRYRDFFSGRDLLVFLDFAALYGNYLLAKLHRSQWAGQFSTEGLDTLMKLNPAQNFTPIIENDGFRAIATAIRSATVRAQYASARNRSHPYEVRYGLGQELLRAAAYPQDFLATLGGFIQSYNAENARIDERIAKGSLSGNTPRRASVRTDHLDQIVRLIDTYQGNSELICKMLVAYGYARDPHVAGEQPEQAPIPTDSEDGDDSGEA